MHWQLLVITDQTRRLAWLKSTFGDGCHWELSRSEAADAYVWKEETRVGHQFELGKRPIRRNCKRDWDAVWEMAKSGRYDEIDKSILVPHYSAIRRITQDNLQPPPIVRTVSVFWGRTGTGKSRRAWDEAGMDAYCKDPRTKFWDGYRGQKHVVIDEFRGAIDVSHLLRWFDRYPVNVEVKGSSTVLLAERIWLTSNVSPELWYPGLDEETFQALLRRLNVERFE